MPSLSPADFAQLASGFTLLGLIWVVQLLVYPTFLRIAPDDFPYHHRRHATCISWVVIPLMLTELTSTLWLLAHPGALGRSWQVALSGLVLVAWLSTFLIQVPLHHRLQAGFDLPTLQRLIFTNWIRTAAWSGKALLLGLAYLGR